MLWFQQSLCVVPAHQALHVYMGWCVCDVPVPFHAVVDLGGFSGFILCENNAAALGVEGFCQFCSVCSCNDSISGSIWGRTGKPFPRCLWSSLQKASLVLVLLRCICQHQWQWMFEYSEKEQNNLWVMLLNDQVKFFYRNPALGKSCSIEGNTLSLADSFGW